MAWRTRNDELLYLEDLVVLRDMEGKREIDHGTVTALQPYGWFEYEREDGTTDRALAQRAEVVHGVLRR